MSLSDLFLLGAADACGGAKPIVVIIIKFISFFSIVIPIALIIFGTIDLGKAVIASDEKEVKGAQSRLIKRFIYAALVFFIPTLVAIVMDLVAAGMETDSEKYDSKDTAKWSACWEEARGKKNKE